jgi:hypothetical protein
MVFITAYQLDVVNRAVPELNNDRRFIVVPQLNDFLFAERFDVATVYCERNTLIRVFDVNENTIALKAQRRFHVDSLIAKAKSPAGKIDRPSAREGR